LPDFCRKVFNNILSLAPKFEAGMFFTGLSGHILPLLLTAVFPLIFLLSGGRKAEKPAVHAPVEVSVSADPGVFARPAAASGFSSLPGFGQSVPDTGPCFLTKETHESLRIPPGSSPGVPLPAVYYHSGNKAPPAFFC
jgi:hypothetical protein